MSFFRSRTMSFQRIIADYNRAARCRLNGFLWKNLEKDRPHGEHPFRNPRRLLFSQETLGWRWVTDADIIWKRPPPEVLTLGTSEGWRVPKNRRKVTGGQVWCQATFSLTGDTRLRFFRNLNV